MKTNNFASTHYVNQKQAEGFFIVLKLMTRYLARDSLVETHFRSLMTLFSAGVHCSMGVFNGSKISKRKEWKQYTQKIIKSVMSCNRMSETRSLNRIINIWIVKNKTTKRLFADHPLDWEHGAWFPLAILCRKCIVELFIIISLDRLNVYYFQSSMFVLLKPRWI